MSEHTTPAPALGYSVTANIGGDSQVVFQCFVGEDEDDAAVNGKLERIMGFVDRLKARAEMPGLRADLAKHEQTLAQMQEDKARIEATYKSAVACADVEVQTLNEKAGALVTEAQRRHADSGRQGVYTPSGQTKSSLNRIEAQIDTIKGEKTKAEAERQAALENLFASEKRFGEAIERLKGEIAEREAKLAGT